MSFQAFSQNTFNRLKKVLDRRNRTSEDAKNEAAKIREQIMTDGNVAKRLMDNPDFVRFCEILGEDRDDLLQSLIKENPEKIKSHEQNVRIIARINQLDKILGKPKSMIWQMENLTEVRAAVQEQTRVRQAHGNKTGGNDE
jgi:hypothetical protein